MSKLREHEQEVLQDLRYATLDGEYVQPRMVGGRDASHHSRTLAKLCRLGLAERAAGGGWFKQSWRYRAVFDEATRAEFEERERARREHSRQLSERRRRTKLAALLLALPALAHAQDPGALRALMVEREARHEARVLDALTARAGAAGMVVEVTPADAGVAEAAEAPVDPPFGVQAAAICSVARGEESGSCDMGMAGALAGRRFRAGRLAAVGFLGVETLGLGGAWCPGAWCVGAGYGVPYGDGGIKVDEGAVFVGGTLSLARAVEWIGGRGE